ncbi:hypothetical protein JOQ06_029242 [Pogonophryne albipinna]|uniref:Uncharacterized protein n=1 Tax=Pogonophryne albipinna TaxID=1090488 RepID=A0AAD6BCW7_9TELE|nr:hypothetical protein JOQ06_029242 [Pogonophryne albipinna]
MSLQLELHWSLSSDEPSAGASVLVPLCDTLSDTLYRQQLPAAARPHNEQQTVTVSTCCLHGTGQPEQTVLIGSAFVVPFSMQVLILTDTLNYNLTKQQNGFKITLKTLEDSLLSHLSLASGNFLGDRAGGKPVQEAKVTEARINEARELDRPAAARASLLYFIMNDLNKIQPMYQFSLKAFRVVFQRAYTTRGLFECDKLMYSAQLTFQVLLMNKEINPAELDFLLRYPVQPAVVSVISYIIYDTISPLDFLSNHSWGGAQGTERHR